MIQPFDLNLRHLRALDAIAARGSISAAAQAVSLSQPALTQGLAKLERQVNCALFERRAGGMTATAEGVLLAARARAAFDHLAAGARGGRGFARPEMLMTSAQARAFLALADAGSFVGAAAATGLSQPGIHRAASDLEQVVGTPLIEKRGRGVVLNPAGLRLARGIRLAACEIAAALADMADDASRGGDQIIVGAMPLCRARLLPAAIARLAADVSGAHFNVVEGSWRELVSPLRDGRIDLMIGALRPENEVPDLRQIALFEDLLIIVGRNGHPLGHGPTPDRAALARFPWIVGRAGSPLRAQWAALFADDPLPPAPIECGSVMTIRGLLANGDFLTLLSPDQLITELASGLLRQIGPALAGSVRTIGVSTRRDWRPTIVQQRFLDVLEQIGSQFKIQENE